VLIKPKKKRQRRNEHDPATDSKNPDQQTHTQAENDRDQRHLNSCMQRT